MLEKEEICCFFQFLLSFTFKKTQIIFYKRAKWTLQSDKCTINDK